MPDKSNCVHPVDGFRWVDDNFTKKPQWVKCSVCGEQWPFNWLLAADIPTRLSNRMGVLAKALGQGEREFAPTRPVEASEGLDAILGPEVTVERNAHLLRTCGTYAYTEDGNDES